MKPISFISQWQICAPGVQSVFSIHFFHSFFSTTSGGAPTSRALLCGRRAVFVLGLASGLHWPYAVTFISEKVKYCIIERGKEKKPNQRRLARQHQDFHTVFPSLWDCVPFPTSFPCFCQRLSRLSSRWIPCAASGCRTDFLTFQHNLLRE